MEFKPKLIADIRCYETPGRTAYGHVRLQTFGSIYNVPSKKFRNVAERFACKLRELKFTLPEFHHLYVVLTPQLPTGKAELSDVKPENWQRLVDVGLDPKAWGGLDNCKKHDLLVDLIASALSVVSNHEQTEIINDVSEQLKKAKTEIEILVKSRETSRYRADVSFQVTPKQGASVAFLTYFDKRSKLRGRAVLTELELAADIYPLCGSISEKNGSIIISPRSSFRASVVAAQYQTPFSVPIQDLIGVP